MEKNISKSTNAVPLPVNNRIALQQLQPKPTRFNLNKELQSVTNHFIGLKEFINKNKYNNKYAIVINFKIPSYKKRLFVYDVQANKIVSSALVSHGQGSVTKGDSLRFSNIVDSKQSSLGKYKIGNSYFGQWGYAYRLHGLDKTNSRALERFIVLHYYKDVPDEETNEHIILSSGCPMVSPKYMKELKKYITPNSTILSIFY